MIRLITRFVNYLVGSFNWQVLAFLAVVFFIIGLFSVTAGRRRARYNAADQPNASFVPGIVGFIIAFLFFFFGVSVTGKLETKQLLKTNTETVTKECFDCLDSRGEFVYGIHYGVAETIPANRWFAPVGELKPVVLDRIEVLPVHPAYNPNPRYGFNTRKAYMVVYRDLDLTDELRRDFDEWELLFWAIALGFIAYLALNQLMLRRLRSAVYSAGNVRPQRRAL